jgi:hypothetical protein
MAFGLSSLVRGDEGIRRRSRGMSRLFVFILGLVAASSLVGSAIAAGGKTLGLGLRSSPWPLACACLIGAAVELGLTPFATPTRHWQVPPDWPRRFGSLSGYGLWGITLGVGFLTFVPFASFYVYVLWLLYSGSVVLGMGMGAAYGIGRAIGSVGPAVAIAIKGNLSPATVLLDKEAIWRGGQVAVLLTVSAVLVSSSS